MLPGEPKSVFRNPAPRPPEVRLEEKILDAFDMGRKAARMDKLRCECPYAPASQPELYDSWCCGYDEEDLLYKVAPAEPSESSS